MSKDVSTDICHITIIKIHLMHSKHEKYYTYFKKSALCFSGQRAGIKLPPLVLSVLPHHTENTKEVVLLAPRSASIYRARSIHRIGLESTVMTSHKNGRLASSTNRVTHTPLPCALSFTPIDNFRLSRC